MKTNKLNIGRRIFALFVLSLTLLVSCEKDEDTRIPPSPYIIMDLERGITALNSADSKAGNNLYPEAGDKKYLGYYDEVTDLEISMHQNGFAYGGAAPSIYNDMEQAGYENQCSVYHKDEKTGFGGRNGSQTFIVAYCGVGAGIPKMQFKTEGVEKIIDHLYVINNTYAVLSMLKGDSFAKKMSYADKDWFKLTFTGYDKDGEATKSVDFFMADFRIPDAPGIVTQWTKVDLSSLGMVHSIGFAMTSSDGEGMWMNTPAYFCFDDVAVLK